MDDWAISWHAKKRMAEMEVSTEEVLYCLADPSVCYPQPSRGPNYRVAQRGPIGVVYNPVDRVVVTVLWNTQERYVRKSPSP